MPDWKDIGRTAFGVVHTAGSAVLSAFGAGGAAKSLEQLESPILPDWAKSGGGSQSASAIVTAPSYVVIVRGGKTDVLQNVAQVAVSGGKRFEGNGYQTGEPFGKRFSFGYDAPARVEVVPASGVKGTVSDASKVLFCGGVESSATRVSGEEEIVSDEIGVDWWQIFYNPAGIAMDAMKDSNAGPANAPTMPQPWDYTSTARYQQALQRFKDAQALQTAARGRAAPQAPAGVIPVSVPSFNLPTGSMDMSDLSVLGDVIVGELGEFSIADDPESAEVEPNSYIYGTDILGAAPPPKKLSQTLRSIFKMPARKGAGGKSPHKEALKRASAVADRAARAGTMARARAAQYDPRKHTTIIPLKAVQVKGTIVLGTATALTAAQQKAVQKHTDALARHRALVERSKKAAATAISKSNELRKLTKDKAAPIGRLLKPVIKRTVVLGYWTEVIGVEPDPSNPGYLMDGTVDPNYVEPGTSSFVPPVRNQVLSKADAMLPWDKVPDDGVVYDGRYGIPGGAGGIATHDGFGSAGGYFGGEGNPGKHNMYRWSQSPERWTYFSGGPDGDMDDATQGTSNKVQLASLGRNWGPLIGDPGNQYVKGLQYAAQEDKWFWQSDKAPTWATQEADAALAALDKKTKEAAAAAAAADAARLAQEQAQQAEDQAKQDAANALAQSAADTQSQIAQQQQAAQQAQLDVQQQAYDQKIAAAQAQAALQQQAIMNRATQADLDYAIAHPEVAMQEQYDGGYAGDEGYAEQAPVDEGVDWGESSGDVTSQDLEEG